MSDGTAADIRTRQRDIGWRGYHYVQKYTLSDRFFGRETYLEKLSRWAENVGADAPSVFCLTALGGLGPVSEGFWAFVIGIGGLAIVATWIAKKGARAR